MSGAVPSFKRLPLTSAPAPQPQDVGAPFTRGVVRTPPQRTAKQMVSGVRGAKRKQPKLTSAQKRRAIAGIRAAVKSGAERSLERGRGLGPKSPVEVAMERARGVNPKRGD